jgi:hypothetical protein
MARSSTKSSISPRRDFLGASGKTKQKKKQQKERGKERKKKRKEEEKKGKDLPRQARNIWHCFSFLFAGLFETDPFGPLPNERHPVVCCNATMAMMDDADDEW